MKKIFVFILLVALFAIPSLNLESIVSHFSEIEETIESNIISITTNSDGDNHIENTIDKTLVNTNPNNGIVINATPGQLENILSSFDCSQIKTLTIRGHMDARDFMFIKLNCIYLENIDLSNVYIDEYIGLNGTYDESKVKDDKVYDVVLEPDDVKYDANAIPPYAFAYVRAMRIENGELIREKNPCIPTGMPYLKTVKLPNSITKICHDAFVAVNNLKEIDIPERVDTIEFFAFAYCKSLEKVTFPSTINRIGPYAFGEQDNPKEMHFKSICPPDAMCAFTTPSNVYIPKGCRDNYKIWDNYGFNNIIEE